MNQIMRVVGVAELPSSKRRGGRDINKNVAKPPLTERTGWSGTSQVDSELTTPSAALRWASPPFFLMPQPPLLYQEGSCQPPIPVHKF